MEIEGEVIAEFDATALRVDGVSDTLRDLDCLNEYRELYLERSETAGSRLRDRGGFRL